LPTEEVGGNNVENVGRKPEATVKDLLRYDQMVETAMRGVVREALARTVANGLPGAHHFYVTFKTQAPGVGLAPHLGQKYPDEMTIVLEHQFWDLQVREDDFAVTLSFNNRPERITIPFAAIAAFADPSVKFGLQFPASGEVANEMAEPSTRPISAKLESAKAVKQTVEAQPQPVLAKRAGRLVGKPGPAKAGEVVALDAFRKK
jgi:uncharacterized protein